MSFAPKSQYYTHLILFSEVDIHFINAKFPLNNFATFPKNGTHNSAHISKTNTSNSTPFLRKAPLIVMVRLKK